MENIRGAASKFESCYLCQDFKDCLDLVVGGSKNIIYSAAAGEDLQLFSVPRANGASQQLTHDSGNLMHPRVSPDGRWIARARIVQSRQVRRRPLF
jgi:tricorn protease-like protein